MSDDKPLSKWARAHGKGKVTPPYVPKTQPESAPAVESVNDSVNDTSVSDGEAERDRKAIQYVLNKQREEIAYRVAAAMIAAEQRRKSEETQS